MEFVGSPARGRCARCREAAEAFAWGSEIDKQDLLADGGQGRARLIRGSWSYDAALLIGDREYLRPRIVAGSVGGNSEAGSVTVGGTY